MTTTNGRQRRAEGSIQERPDGTWRIFVSGGTDAMGRRVRVSEIVRGTRRDANRRLHEIAQAIRSGAYVPGHAQTMREFIHSWWPSKRSSIAPTTAVGYERLLNRYILPALGAKRLQRIASADVSALIGALVDQGRVGQADHVYTLCRLIFNAAIRGGTAGKNPVLGVDRPRSPHREMATVTLEQWGRVRQHFEGRESWALLPLTVLITSGLRRSEVLALQWRDLDFERGVLTVQRSFHVLPGGDARVERPKTRRSRRAVALDHHTTAALADHRRRGEHTARLLSRRFRETDFVFAREDGTPCRPDNLSQVWGRAAKKLGIKARLHDLRHTSASLMLASGANPKLISERLGHSSTAFTLDTYTHVLVSAQAEAAEKLGAMLGNGRQPEALPAA